jgi:hypothetical protein
MLEIISPITGERLQVAENDLEKKMDWFSAKKKCAKQGSGWRLPTISELELMYKMLHKKGKGNFKNDIYWSNTGDIDVTSSHEWGLYFNFATGSTKKMLEIKDYNYQLNNMSAKDCQHCVRLVRSYIYLFS